jgi:pimeloyl-ACP methyl ester carboxylesterase
MKGSRMSKRLSGYAFRSSVMAAAITAVFSSLYGCAGGDAGPGGGRVQFYITYADSVSGGPLDGMLFVLLDSNLGGNPLFGPDPSDPEPVLAADFRDWKPGEVIALGDGADAYPFRASDMPPGQYVIRVVADVNTVERSFTLAKGNLFNASDTIEIPEQGSAVFNIDLVRTFEGFKFEETEDVREVRLESALLSGFCGEPAYIEAAVILPPSYQESPGREYVSVYVLPGWGSTHHAIHWGDFQRKRYGMNTVGEEKIFIFLNQECASGYHGFADSDNNGPRGASLVEEFIPLIEEKFRVIPAPAGRFLVGQSSGAWAALWLQINYPGVFSGAFAASPDPVDFRDFVGINIYEPGANFFRDSGGEPAGSNRTASDLEEVTGPGGQLYSFEAVFGGRREDGRPEKLWDRESGSIDPAVAEQWKRYDIRLVLEDAWPVVGSILSDRLHIYVAADDDYGLDGPVRLLEEAARAGGWDIETVFFEKGGHDLWNDALRARIHSVIDSTVEADSRLRF